MMFSSCLYVYTLETKSTFILDIYQTLCRMLFVATSCIGYFGVQNHLEGSTFITELG